MTGQQGPLDLGADGVLESDDPRKARLTGPQTGEQVVPEFLLDGSRSVRQATKGPKCGGSIGGHPMTVRADRSPCPSGGGSGRLVR